MSETRTLLAEHKTIELRAPCKRLSFDHCEGTYRGALYLVRRNRWNETVDDRVTAKAATLEDLLLALFNVERRNDRIREIEAYVHSTEWGRDLP